MKKAVVLAVAALLCVCFAFSSCTATHDKAPAEFKELKWYAPDYSFTINAADNCTGVYKFNGKTYKTKSVFDGGYISVKDTENKDAELFNAQWMYEEENSLYVYDIIFNTKDYPDFKSNFAEFVRMNSEKAK